MSNLNGKVAVITGGSSGIGLATARRFVDEGAYVFITGRRRSELDRVTATIGKNVTAIAGDVANLSDLDRLYATVVAEKKRIDILVANAGAVELLHLPDVTEAHFDHTFSLTTPLINTPRHYTRPEFERTTAAGRAVG
jgi:NAD(P)-dependent dehydrogenase (short-subunit alcohol dehydrogenase family)